VGSTHQLQDIAVGSAHPTLNQAAADHAELLELIFDRAGLARSYRPDALGRRLPACLRALKVHSAEEARQLLLRRPELLPAALSALLIGVTEFFRDRAVFEGIRTEVLPRLAGRDGTLRVWSAGCSTGEEVYSMAILLAEAALLERSWLLGTDCRGDAIGRARESQYCAAAIQALDASIRTTYFEPIEGDGGGFAKAASRQERLSREASSVPVCPAFGSRDRRVSRTLRWRPVAALRGRARWKVADLTRTVEIGPWDMILCRNLAIYLERGSAAAIWQRLADALRPGGLLVVGKAERPPAGIGLLPLRRCIYRKTDARRTVSEPRP
jgi:chemotaxis protein methyltransferase CheR